MEIPFNKPFFIENEFKYIQDSVKSLKISGDGPYTKKCHEFFATKMPFKYNLLVHSCTAALEMAALLLDIKEGDEVIIPSYTFVSTANAFILRGAKVIFADSCENNPNIDADHIEKLITPATKAVVVVHYAGISCDMGKISKLCADHSIDLIEDAAHAIDSFYNDQPLGTFGRFSTFSFHETKNIISGEGGLLVCKNREDYERAQIIREKGTNRSAFFRGEVDKYGWVDIGSSYLPSDIIAAYLFAQLENLATIQKKRKDIWNNYHNSFKPFFDKIPVNFPEVPEYATVNGHLYYLVFKNEGVRSKFINHMKENKIGCVFHYQALHNSSFYRKIGPTTKLPNTERYTDCLVRLPLFYQYSEKEQEFVIEQTISFFKEQL